ncbi:MAG: bacillithiol biosynthesis cysteine-adding enzyme BshC [Cytophagales bacterium]|nr:bacillithiol biosynthesis cysteine-adding enzyme BshC [Cytophagales bacterium]
MQTEKIDLDETDCFSSFFIDYIKGDDRLKPFYQATPVIENFSDQIANRSFPTSHRETLVAVLKEQYRDLTTSSAVSDNIESLLSEKTFTVTTGHQMNIFTGPLYFIYKIVTVINAVKSLKEKYTELNFVPVYWMASEDHDFDEINHFHLHGKKFQWNTTQTGAVGQFDPSELKDLLAQLSGDVSLFEKAYLENTNLADACRHYVNALFDNNGLVVVDSNHPVLKKEFTEVIENDLFEHTPNLLVTSQTEKLEELGFKTQINSRLINFFYMHEGIRARIEKSEKEFHVLETNLKFSAVEIKTLIKEHPERFSPNVVLRPLYQEMILPNLAYIGGPSELVYWLQLKPMFDHFKTPFPLLMPRNFGLVISANQKNKWNKTGFTIADLFLATHGLEKQWVKNNSLEDLTYVDESEKISGVFKTLAVKAGAADPTLVQHIEALSKQVLNRLELAEKKLVRAKKRQHRDTLSQITAVKNALFPNGGLQERHDNFLNFYQTNPDFIPELLKEFDPFDYRMHVLLV